MEWSYGENRMLSSLESLIHPERTIKYYCCFIRRRQKYC